MSTMSRGEVVHLMRDGHDQPWGFRLQGGADIGTPLKVQRVSVSTPGEGILHAGDYITRIGQYDATKLTHEQASDLIKNAGNQISLVICRSGKSAKPSSPATKSTPPASPMVNSHPLKGAIPTPFAAAHVTPHTLPKRPSKKAVQQQQQHLPRPAGQRYREVLASPVQTLPHTDQTDAGDASNLEHDGLQTDDEYEKLLITHQPYRTTQLVFPTAKVRKDFSGSSSSFLHQSNPLIQSHGHHDDHTKEVEIKQKIADTIVERAGPLSPNIQHGHGDPHKQQVVHKQYNSPMHLYSKQNIDETIHDQTGVTPGRAKIVVPRRSRKHAVNRAPNPHAAPPIPHAQPKEKPRHYDPRTSATFQALQEFEHGLPTGEQRPIEQKVYNMKRMDPRQASTFRLAERPLRYEGNAVGVTEENIPQSNSFRRLMAEVIGETDF